MAMDLRQLHVLNLLVCEAMLQQFLPQLASPLGITGIPIPNSPLHEVRVLELTKGLF